jgi:hypothetical protein
VFLARRLAAVRRVAADARAVTPLPRERAEEAVAVGEPPAAWVVALCFACPGAELAAAGGALFFACPGAAAFPDGVVVADLARAAFFAWPGGVFLAVFALPTAARLACPGGAPLSAGGFARAGHATAMHSRAVTRRAGTRCKRELGDATVTNFLIGKRRISRAYGALAQLSSDAVEFPHYGRFF